MNCVEMREEVSLADAQKVVALNDFILRTHGFKIGKDAKILDFGCGTGELLKKIYDTVSNCSKLIGIDSSAQSIEQAKNSYHGIDFVRDKFVDSFNFPDSFFDYVISVDTLECIQNKTALLNEIHRILKKEGQVLFSHWDWDTQVYCSEHKEIIRKFVAAFSDWQQGWMDASDGQMGRKLWGIFHGKGGHKGGKPWEWKMRFKSCIGAGKRQN